MAVLPVLLVMAPVVVRLAAAHQLEVVGVTVVQGQPVVVLQVVQVVQPTTLQLLLCCSVPVVEVGLPLLVDRVVEQFGLLQPGT
jgi:hypothetical protein